jgi:trans-aconitate 2-methyltransferase
VTGAIWDPSQYLRFAGERLRPALDLIARIPLESPRVIYDLGCGPGTVTALLKKRWPSARITGVDSSEAMLAKARELGPELHWQASDLTRWSPDSAPDLLFSNAALHWLDGHETLFPRLLERLNPGGVLAVQMPRNFDAPTHTAIAEAIESGPWRERLAPLFRARPVLDLESYQRILRSSARVDLWETTYLHVLEGDDPVVEWTRGSVLKPILDRLPGGEADRFLEAYRALVRKAYPREPDGTTLLPFRRIFLLAVAPFE